MVKYKKAIVISIMLISPTFAISADNFRSVFSPKELVDKIKNQDESIEYGYLHKCAKGYGLLAKEQEYFAVTSKADYKPELELFTIEPIEMDLEEVGLFNLRIPDPRWIKLQSDYSNTNESMVYLNFDKSSDNQVKYAMSPRYSLPNTEILDTRFFLKYSPFGDLQNQLSIECVKNEGYVQSIKDVSRDAFIASVNSSGARWGGNAYPLTPEGFELVKEDFLNMYKYMFKNKSANYLKVYHQREQMYSYIKIAKIGLISGTWISIERINRGTKRDGYYINYNMMATPIP